MKDKIKQAGFKSQASFARYYNTSTTTVSLWCKTEPPRRVVEHLNLIIRCNVLEKENIALQEALKTFKQYCNQGKVVDYLKAGEQKVF